MVVGWREGSRDRYASVVGTSGTCKLERKAFFGLCANSRRTANEENVETPTDAI